MTTEIRTNANAAIINALAAALPGATWVRVGKKNMLAVPSGVKDENGTDVWVTVECTAKNTQPTSTTPAFDVAKAHEDYEAYVTEKANAPAKASTPKVSDEEKAAKAAAREANVKAICAWALEGMEEGHEYTTTEIKECVPGMEEMSILALGTLMKDVVATGLVSVEVKASKKYYTKA